VIEGKNFINGQWRTGENATPVMSPAQPSELVGSILLSTQDDVSAAVDAAEDAGMAWKKLGMVARGNLLFQAAEALEPIVDELATLAAREMGKPVAEARGEALRAVAILRYYAGEGLRSVGDVIPSSNAQSLQYTTRTPLGVVAVVTPWNFPLAIPMWKVAPALVYGNTVVLKPAEWSSLTAIRMMERIGALFPQGVLNLITGLGSITGEALIRHPKIRGISFTGSTTVGAHIAEVATANGVKYQAEMGGKNAVVVTADANLELAVDSTVSGAMRSAGQKCTATSRVIVLSEIHDLFLDRLRERLTKIKQGNPLDTDTYLGPVVSASQYQKVSDYIALGDQEGHLVVGGVLETREATDGYYIAPTVFDHVQPSARIAQEEIFGPVVSVITADSLEEAITVTNGIRYGLSASIFTQNLHTALQFVEEVEVGLVRVNEETAGVELQAPFGGVKASSSHSREQGRSALEFYTDIKTVSIRP